MPAPRFTIRVAHKSKGPPAQDARRRMAIEAQVPPPPSPPASVPPPRHRCSLPHPSRPRPVLLSISPPATISTEAGDDDAAQSRHMHPRPAHLHRSQASGRLHSGASARQTRRDESVRGWTVVMQCWCASSIWTGNRDSGGNGRRVKAGAAPSPVARAQRRREGGRRYRYNGRDGGCERASSGGAVCPSPASSSPAGDEEETWEGGAATSRARRPLAWACALDPAGDPHCTSGYAYPTRPFCSVAVPANEERRAIPHRRSGADGTTRSCGVRAGWVRGWRAFLHARRVLPLPTSTLEAPAVGVVAPLTEGETAGGRRHPPSGLRERVGEERAASGRGFDVGGEDGGRCCGAEASDASWRKRSSENEACVRRVLLRIGEKRLG
ncbi:hypothetical protein B0H11DRAFT_566318 [Mycena galericulata]|nr:hypothetical protein B0H11DRAFT_566318 [Mycena galericulata]